MFARVAPLLLVVCLVLGGLWIATSGGSDRSPDYEAELARIDRAKPPPRHVQSEAEVARQLRNSKKVRWGHGWAYVPRHFRPIKRTATAAVDGCGGPPGVTAKLIRDGLTVLVTYRVGNADAGCAPTLLSLTADVSDDFLGGDGLDYRIEHEAGQVELPLHGHVANADVLIASTWTPANGGLSSGSTTIRIRGAAAPGPTMTAPAPPATVPGTLARPPLPSGRAVR